MPACSHCGTGRMMREVQPYSHDTDEWCLNCGRRAVDVTDKLDPDRYGTAVIGSPMSQMVQYSGMSVSAPSGA